MSPSWLAVAGCTLRQVLVCSNSYRTRKYHVPTLCNECQRCIMTCYKTLSTDMNVTCPQETASTASKAPSRVLNAVVEPALLQRKRNYKYCKPFEVYNLFICLIVPFIKTIEYPLLCIDHGLCRSHGDSMQRRFPTLDLVVSCTIVLHDISTRAFRDSFSCATSFTENETSLFASIRNIIRSI